MKHIITDLGNCLLKFDFEQLLENMATKSQYSKQQIKNVLIYSKIWNKFSRGEISAKDFFIFLRRKLDFFDSFSGFEFVWTDRVFSLNKSYFSMLYELMKKNHKIYMLSNIDETHWGAVERNFSDYLSIFSRCFLSFRMRKIKPEIKIYKEVKNEIRNKAVFLDDMDENIYGAKKAGLEVIKYDYSKHEEFEKKLFSLLAK